VSEDFSVQVAIIGSGPAAVAAAGPILAAGLEVLMLEAGEWSSPDFPNESWTDFRTGSTQQWPVLGSKSGWPAAKKTKSPKFSVPWIRGLVDGAPDALAFRADGFEGTPLAAVGGLSTAWGAGLGLFDANDIRHWPIDWSELLESYGAIADQIGASGHWLETHLPAPATLKPHPGLHPTAAKLLSRAEPRSDFSVVPALSAVLAENRGERRACDRGGSCLYGCPRESIWSAAYEVRAFERNPRFRLLTGVRVDKLEKREPGWTLVCRTGVRIRARHVICAAGAIGSPRLTLPLIAGAPRETRLLSSPAAAFALLLPSRLGAAWERRFFGLAQLQIKQSISSEEYVLGNLFCGEGVPLRFLASMVPFAPRLARRVFRDLVPACLFGNVFFDGRHSQHTLSISAEGEVRVAGGHAPTIARVHAAAARSLRASFGRLGAVLLPMKPVLAEPGSDLHYAGSLPMSDAPVPGRTDRWGVPFGAADLVVVDGSVLCSLPPKGHTFTIMANAHRLGRHWAGHWASA
jgi:choline dehydrogenase-like flavoprotein